MKLFNNFLNPTQVLFFLILISCSTHCLFGIKITLSDELTEEIDAIEVKEKEEYERISDSEANRSSDSEESDVAALDLLPPVTGPETLVDMVENQGGQITGQVFDKESGETLSGVVIVIEDTDFATLSDSQGRFNFSGVDTDVYVLTFFKDGYLQAKVTDTVVTSQEATVLNFAMPRRPIELSDDVYELQDFVVTAKEASSQFLELLDLKELSVGSLNFLSSEDMAKFGGSDIADVVKRLPGVNVVEGKFAVVRGLSDRYNTTFVNKVPMPSPDPIRQGMQLDLFPTSIIENIITNKVFMPQFLGNSSGGAFDLATKSFSNEIYNKFKIGFSQNSNAKDTFLKSPYSSSDDLMFNSSNRKFYNARELDNDFIPNFVGLKDDPFLGGSFAYTHANKLLFNNKRSLNYLVSLSYNTSSKTKKGSFRNYYTSNSRAFGATRNSAQAWNDLDNDGLYDWDDVNGNNEIDPGEKLTEGIPSSRGIDSGNGDGRIRGPRSLYGYPPGFIPSALINNYASNESSWPGMHTALFVPGSLASDTPYLISGVFYENYINSQLTSLGGLLYGFKYNFDDKDKNYLTFNSLNSLSIIDSVVRYNNGTVLDRSADPAFSDGDVPAGKDSNPAVESEAETVNGEKNIHYVNKEILSYEKRMLRSYILNGNHKLDGRYLRTFNWAASDSYVSSYTPLRTESFFFQNSLLPENGYYLISSSQAGEPPFIKESTQKITQNNQSKRADFSLFLNPLSSVDEKIKLDIGYFSENSNRIVSGSNVSIIAENSAEATRGDNIADLSNVQNALVSEGGVDPFTIVGQVYGSDAEVNKGLNSHYLSLEIPLLKNVILSTGYRIDDLEISSSGSAALASEQGSSQSAQGGYTLQNLLDGDYRLSEGEALTNGDILNWTDASQGGYIKESFRCPSYIVKANLTSNLIARLSSTRTYSIPSFREISPYFDYEPSTADVILGNPNLRPSSIENYDLNFDYKLNEESFLSISLFKKRISKPIEKVKLKGTDRFKFTSYFNNSNDADLKGIEVEFRGKLSSIIKNNSVASLLNDISLGLNYTIIDAQIKVPSEILTTYTTNNTRGPQGPFVGADVLKNTRGLYDQPEWIMNADLTYELENYGTSITIAYYAQSNVLNTVGSGNAEGNGLSTLDEYLSEYSQIDLNLKQKVNENSYIRFKVGNITDSKRSIIYDPSYVVDYERLSYRNGKDYSISYNLEF